ncbi:hypothetical protein Sango_2429200 [Sesamum angolense]|uniref:Integrase catalytic domain-containing protein n=1 Tax=Sesamum angolense TaxID=2727404 RepID=A0AAE1W7M3_9LAMI|nr:hypothetical protein Sango_2429200 [Sesamum angolense]
MVKDCLEYAKKCVSCQLHSNFIHQPLEPLHPTVTSWSFHAWGLDFVGPITPKSFAGHIYILAATDYFLKWAEAVPLKEVKKEIVIDFIRVNIIFRYGIPRYIITDNGRPFYNKLMDKLCAKFGFMQHNSSMYNTAENAMAEAFNKTLCNLLKKSNTFASHRDTRRTHCQGQCPLRLEELEALDGKRLEAQQQLQYYQACMIRAFNKKV